MTNLMPEEINRVLAEWMGWRRFGMFGPYGKCAIISLGVSLHGTPPEDKDKPEDDQAYLPVPQFATDLNAIATIEAKLTDEQKRSYSYQLCMNVAESLGLNGDADCLNNFDLIHASALQRAIALCHVLCL